MSRSDLDRRHMALALRLAAKGRGATSPNPMVGAVIVANGRVVGRGYHRRAGEPHAERLALRAAGRRARGATLYVTLEPCSHTKKRTPPCVPAVLASGLRRIVVGMKDPNPLVAGRGIRALRRAGIRVEVGCLGKEAERLNQFYCHWRRTGRPFVILKAAMTLDGKIATAGGESRWITGPAARREVHRLRSQVDAILVGIGTVLRDDPRLTARPPHRAGHAPRQPLRVILDSTLRIPPSARVLTRPPGSPTVNTLIVTTVRAPRQRIRRLRERGVEVLVLPSSRGQVSLRACLAHLGKRGISSALIEGGSRIHASALRENLVDHVKLFVAPRLLGGQDAKAVIGGASPKRLAEAVPLHRVSVTNLDGDFLIEGTPAR